MKTNIPIYRAKKIDSDEYVEGFLFNPMIDVCFMFRKGSGTLDEEQSMCIIEGEYEEVEYATLAIHFPDMIDSEGTKIFASLSEDGKGGDTLNGKFMLFVDNIDVVCKFYKTEIVFSGINRHDYENELPLISYSNMKNLKVTGVQL